MQKVLGITNKYISIATPLILYSLISSIYLTISMQGGKLINLIFSVFLFFLMTGAFIAGWFNMIKIAVTSPESDNQNVLIKEFVSGVGEYFLPSCGAMLLISTIMLFVSFLSYYLGMFLIGNPDISMENLSKALYSQEALKAFVSALTLEQLTKISLWNILVLISMSIGNFILFLFIPALFFNNKNPLLAFLISIKNLFSRKFFKSVGIYLLILTINFTISLFLAVLGKSMIAHLLLTLLNFYFITAVGVGVFYYYYNNFIVSKLGQNVDIEI